eukprot:CAMPEP_0172469562 /NCGR_PEP_ID=MMETSP1065-20121228/64066_1 /TAXON_ID=265537 /ORGANISM="Amphiprora paludosa, Strain CCMP125" /LENGTH=66 /DNA_ID=CAMNT_0013227273 /DNA_START=48 /DNA_END=244 /DNA_ORIENTATION=+
MAGQLEVVNYLVGQKGANMEAKTNDGWTPLHWASKRGHLEVVRRLFDLGANVNKQDICGLTPLHLA